MTEIVIAGCGIKIFGLERDVLILASGKRGIALKLTAGCKAGNDGLRTLRVNILGAGGGMKGFSQK